MRKTENNTDNGERRLPRIGTTIADIIIIVQVKEFVYLDSLFSSDGKCEEERRETLREE